MRSHLAKVLIASLSITGALALSQNQAPIMKPSEISSSLLISDVLPRQQRIAIFSSFTRDVDSVSNRLESSVVNATVLAPENDAVRSLPRKPWEDPEEYRVFGENVYAGDDGNKRAQQNLKRFVEAHIVPRSPWQAGEKVETLAGNEVWYETQGNKMMIQPGNIEVLEVADKVANGEVWVLKGIINYAK